MHQERREPDVTIADADPAPKKKLALGRREPDVKVADADADPAARKKLASG